MRHEIELEPLHAFEKLALEENARLMDTIIRHRHEPLSTLCEADQEAFKIGYDELFQRHSGIMGEIARRRATDRYNIRVHNGRVYVSDTTTPNHERRDPAIV
jgi:hypothetical protein